MRKLLITALVVAMTLSFGATALAAAGDIAPPAFNDIAGHEAEAELTALGALGVYTGDSGLGGPARPDDTITRAEFCKAVVEAMGRGSVAAGLAGLQPTFVDGASIPTWAWGYVNVAVYMGIINGYADGTFGPNNPVNYSEAVTMLVRAVSGHAAQVPPGVWPYNYLFYGIDNGFVGGVDVGFSSLPVTRGDMARMLLATMQVSRLDNDGDRIPGSAILFDSAWWEDGPGLQHAGRLYQGIFEGTRDDNHYAYIYYPAFDSSFELSLADPVHLIGADDYDGLFWMPVWVITDTNGEVIFIQLDEDVSLVSGTLEDIIDTNKNEILDTIVLTDGTEVPMDEDYLPDGVAVGSLDEECIFDSPVVPTIINRFGPVNPLALLWFLPDKWEDFKGTDSVDTECFCGQHYLAPELLITVDDDGMAANIVATVYTKADWIYDMAPSGVDEDGDEIDTSLDLYGAPGYYGYTTPVPSECRVSLDGALAGRDDLAQHDVVSVAYDFTEDTPYPVWFLYWFLGPLSTECVDGDFVPFSVRGLRDVIEGTVTKTATVFPGEIHKVTVDLDGGGDETYVVNEAGGIGDGYPVPYIDAEVRYGLDFDGNVFVPIGYETMTPYVFCRSYTETGDGKYFATFDVRGQEVTYQIDEELDVGEGACEWVGTYCHIYVTPGTGMVDVEESYGDYPAWDCELYQVLNVDATNGTITVGYIEDPGDTWESGDLYFWDDPDFTVYDYDGGDFTYIGLEGLSAGDLVLGKLYAPGAPWSWPVATLVTAAQLEEMDWESDD